MLKCENCNWEITRNLIASEVKEICKCITLCDSCFLIKYILYNTQPIKIIYNCTFCKTSITQEVRDWIFYFAKNYFETEGPFASFYL